MYATYLINASKIWLLLYCTHQSIDKQKEKNLFHVQNCPCGKVSVKINYVLGFFMQGKVVVEFGRKVFLVDCPLRKTLNMAKICTTEYAQAFSCTRKLQVHHHSRKHNCYEVSK